MNQEENNVLIANFMGCRYAPNKSDNNESDYYYEDSELEYHTNWNWLIEVIEKCRERQMFGSQRLISNIDKRLLKLDLGGTYSNVVEFITFYNLQNK